MWVTYFKSHLYIYRNDNYTGDKSIPWFTIRDAVSIMWSAFSFYYLCSYRSHSFHRSQIKIVYFYLMLKSNQKK